MISLSVDDPRLERYLKGETLTIEPEEAAHSKGWHLLCVEGYPLGFGKLVNGTLKISIQRVESVSLSIFAFLPPASCVDVMWRAWSEGFAEVPRKS